MARYIDAEIAEKNIKETILGASEFAVDIRNTALECIRRTPTANVKEVVRGGWIEHINSYENYCECSRCGYIPDSPLDETNFCPNCGAEMGVE